MLLTRAMTWVAVLSRAQATDTMWYHPVVPSQCQHMPQGCTWGAKAHGCMHYR